MYQARRLVAQPQMERPMPSEDPELLRLQGLALAARQRFVRLKECLHEPEVLRHAEDIWLEARAAAAEYEDWHAPRLSQRRN